MQTTGDSIRILHVDDEPDFADTAAAFVEREDDRFTVETTTSASDGLDMLADTGFDCVVSDHDMPEATGIEFLESVRADYPNLPFVLFTGKGSEEVASDAISAGVTDYLQKETGTDQYAILANRISNAVESRRIEHEAERTRAQLDAISESSADAIVTIDSDSRIRFANPAVEDLCGYSPAELRGEPLTTIMPERYRDSHLAAIDQYMETGERTMNWSNVEFPGLHRDGTELPVSVSFGEYELDGSRRFIGILRDISERTRMEADLREREERFRQLAENVQEVVWMADTDDGEIVYANPAYEDIWGQPVETLYDDPTAFLDAIHPDDRDRVEAALDTQATGEFDSEYRIVRPDGEVRWIRARTVPVRNDDGEVYRIVGVASDVTDRRERERQLREKQADLRVFERAVESSTDLLAAVDTEYNLLFANERYRNYHGLSRDTADLGTLPEVLTDTWESEVKQSVDRALAGEVVRYEMERSGPDGDDRRLDIRYYPLTDEDGSIDGAVAAMRDLTERETRE